MFFLIFLTADLIFSNFVYKRNISHKCYEHDEDGKFYKLQKNCFAQMRLFETLDSFKLYTDKNGNRFSGSVTRSTNKNIYFIGDSIAFGLGVNWENSFAGIVESQKKNYNVTNLSVPGYSPSVYNYIYFRSGIDVFYKKLLYARRPDPPEIYARGNAKIFFICGWP